jgi:hypothetical protein
MPCLLLVLALATPRLVVIVLWLFTHWFQGVFPSVVVPIIGFLFLPTTLLWYTAVQHWYGGQWSFWPVVVMVLAVAIDLSPAGGRRWRRPPAQG